MRIAFAIGCLALAGCGKDGAVLRETVAVSKPSRWQPLPKPTAPR